MPPPGKTPNALLHGALDALILKTLTRGPCHGYAVARYIEETTGDALLVEEGSLYPALYRLERRGWVEAEWGTSELGRRAKLYRLTAGRPGPARRRARHLAALLDRRVEGAVRVMRRSLRSWLWRVPVDQEVDEELAFHLEMRTRELVEAGMDPDRRPSHRPRPARRRGGAQTDLRGPGQKARPRDAHRAMDRGVPLRRGVRPAPDAGGAGLHLRGRADAGAGHRRQQRHLRAGRRHAAAAAAVPRSRARRGAGGAHAERIAQRRVAAQPERLGRRQPVDDRDGGVSPTASAAW